MKLLNGLVVAGTLLGAVLMNGGCSYYMLYKVASHDYDDTVADRDIERMEKERTERMVTAGYSDEEIRLVNRNNSRPAARALSLEELREQQARERAERAKKNK